MSDSTVSSLSTRCSLLLTDAMPPLPTSADLRATANELTNEIEQQRLELREIEVLIRQTSGELERLAQKQAENTTRLRQIEANFDAFSREDIKAGYAAERDAQLKLLLMRSQLEQLQSKQRYLDRYIQQLRRVSDLSMQAADAMGGAPANGHSISDHAGVIQTIEAQESERQRLAQQMHDGPAQSLTNLILQAEIVERLFETNPERARGELRGLKTSATVTFQRVRDFIFALRPMMLDDLGLIPTLRRYAQTFESKHHLPLTLTINGDRTLPPYVEVTIFRAMQEFLDNIVEHAHASHAQVSLDLEAEPIVISVEDDGSGFDVKQVLDRARASGSSGLVTLEKRVEMLGGRIAYTSGTGRGTRVRATIPSA